MTIALQFLNDKLTKTSILPNSLFYNLKQTLSTFHNRQCIKEVGNIDHKFFYYGNEALSIKILTSSRLTHKIVSTILKVFAEEVLGYADVSLVQIENPSFSFEPDVQFANISSCEKKE